MKILHVVPYYAPAWGYGGPPRAVYELATQQASEGNQVTVLTTTAKDEETLSAGETVIDGVRVVRLRNISNFLIWKFHFSTPLGVSHFLSKERFDIIHLHEVRTILNYSVLKNANPKAKICISPWGTLPHNNSMKLIKSMFDFFLLSLLQSKVSIAYAQTSHERLELQKWKIGTQQLLVPLGTAEVDERHLPTRSESRNELRIPQNVFAVVYLGRFSPHKGLDLLIQSFKQFSQSKPNVLLVLAGRDDGYSEKLRELIHSFKIEDKVLFTGPLYDAKRYLAYRAGDVFVFCPSVYEETGTVCLEALSSGMPVIVTKEAEIPFMKVKDGVIHVKRAKRHISYALDKVYEHTLSVNTLLLKNIFYWNNISARLTESYNQ